MKKTFFLCFFIVLSVNLKSNDIYDKDVATVDSLLTLAHHESTTQPLRSLYYATEALSSSNQLDYSLGKARACFYIAQAMNYYGDSEKSLTYLSLMEKEKDYYKDNYFFLSEVSRIKGDAYGDLDMPLASKKEFLKGLAFSDKIKENQKRECCLSLAYEKLSFAYEKTASYDTAFNYLNKNAELLKHMDEKSVFINKINMYTMFGMCFACKGKYDSARCYYDSALHIAEKYRYPYTSGVYLHYGDMLRTKGNLRKALDFYYKSLKSQQQSEIESKTPDAYERISTVYKKMGVHDSVDYYNSLKYKTDSVIFKKKSDAYGIATRLLTKQEREDEYHSENKKQLYTILALTFMLIVSTLFWFTWGKKKRSTMTKMNDEMEVLKINTNESFEQVIELAKNNEPNFLTRFCEVYPLFVENIYKKYPDLLASELDFCALIFLNFSSKEIAEYRFSTHRSVQTRKNRLRKRLDITSDVDLYVYLKSFSQP